MFKSLEENTESVNKEQEYQHAKNVEDMIVDVMTKLRHKKIEMTSMLL